MSEDDQYALCWNNYNKNLTSGFHSLYSRGDLTDVTLAAGGQTLKAHRMVLSVCSPYFQTMFESAPASHHPIIFLKDISFKNLTDLVQFMYCGEVHVKQDDLASFISIAESLQVKGLTESGGGEVGPPPLKPLDPPPGGRSLRAAKRAVKKESDDTSPSLRYGKRQFNSSPRLGAKKTLISNQSEDPLQDMASTSQADFIEMTEGVHTKTEPQYDEQDIDPSYLQADESFNASELVEKDDNYDNTYAEMDDNQIDQEGAETEPPPIVYQHPRQPSPATPGALLEEWHLLLEVRGSAGPGSQSTGGRCARPTTATTTPCYGVRRKYTRINRLIQ